jgi:hypothetical protein
VLQRRWHVLCEASSRIKKTQRKASFEPERMLEDAESFVRLEEMLREVPGDPRTTISILEQVVCMLPGTSRHLHASMHTLSVFFNTSIGCTPDLQAHMLAFTHL